MVFFAMCWLPDIPIIGKFDKSLQCESVRMLRGSHNMTVVHIHSCTFGVTVAPWVLGVQGVITHHQHMLGVVDDIRDWCVPGNVSSGWQSLTVALYRHIPTDADQGYSILSVP
jgi:hypothetical protein